MSGHITYTRILPLGLLLLAASCGGGSVGGTSQAPSADAGSADLASPAATAEACDGYDNNNNGQVDEGCPCVPGQTAQCYPGPPGVANVGICGFGTQTCEGASELGTWGPCVGAVTPRPEVCGNGIDEDCDGSDSPCAQSSPPPPPPPPSDAGSGQSADAQVPAAACTPGQTQPCYSGPAGTANVGACTAGTRTCQPDGQWGQSCDGEITPTAEKCGNAIDENCDGKAPECPPVKLPLFLIGDCVWAKCPASDPYPVGCNVIFPPNSEHRGCVAHQSTSSSVFFKAGDSCTKGLVTGFLLCSKTPGPPLGPLNCPIIGKTIWLYPSTPAGCP